MIRPDFSTRLRKWSATVQVSFDGDQFTVAYVYNLLARAGMQVGIGEGRPDSKKSNGMGWGTFEVASLKSWFFKYLIPPKSSSHSRAM